MLRFERVMGIIRRFMLQGIGGLAPQLPDMVLNFFRGFALRSGV